MVDDSPLRAAPDASFSAMVGCQYQNRGYIVKSMKTPHTHCQLNVLTVFSGKLKPAVSVVYFWWFGYGFFSQSPGRP
jgi:hypothetical protein